MYYDERIREVHKELSFGGLRKTVSYFGEGGFKDVYKTSEGYTDRTLVTDKEKIVDYSGTKAGRHTAYSGAFPANYDQFYKPVRHHWQWHEMHPGTGFYRTWSNSLAQYEVEHDGNLSKSDIYWKSPEWKMSEANVFAWPLNDTYGSGYLNWTSIKKDAVDYLPDMLNDNKLLNLEQVDVATFLAELRDIRRLADLVKFNRNHGDISDKFLGIEFGVLPVVSDIKKMYNNIQKITPAFKSWNDMARKQKERAYHKQILKEKEQGTWTLKPGSWGGIINHSYEYVNKWEQTLTKKVHAYVLPTELADTTDLSLQASLWGLDKPLSTLWNVIPMSFAVDWVFHVGDLIADMEHREPDLGFDIISAGASAKLETTIDTDVYCHVNGERIFVGSCHHEYSEYYRAPVPLETVHSHLVDKPIGPLEFTPKLNGMQLSLSAALIHQRSFKF